MPAVPDSLQQQLDLKYNSKWACHKCLCACAVTHVKRISILPWPGTNLLTYLCQHPSLFVCSGVRSLSCLPTTALEVWCCWWVSPGVFSFMEYPLPALHFFRGNNYFCTANPLHNSDKDNIRCSELLNVNPSHPVLLDSGEALDCWHPTSAMRFGWILSTWISLFSDGL